MDFYTLVTNISTAEFIFNLSIQIIAVSLIGWAIMKLWRPRSAPARSAGYLAVLISLAALPLFTAMFNLNQITWFQSTIELPHTSVNQQTTALIPGTVNQEQAGFIINEQNGIPDNFYDEIDTAALPQNLNQVTINNVQEVPTDNEEHETLHSASAYEKADTSFLNSNPDQVTANKPPGGAEGNEQKEIPGSLYKEADTSFFNSDLILPAANIFGAAWIAGFIVFILRLGFKLSFLKGYMHNLSTDNNERLRKIYGNIKHIFNERPMPEIYFSPSLSSPVTVGIIRPVIILPVEMENMSDDELKSILLHELAHIFHRDNFTGFLQHVLSSVFWWNPLVYFLNSAYSDSREDVCDNYAINFLKSPKKYANTLIGLAEQTYLLSHMPATAGMSLSRRSLEHRVLELLKADRDLSTICKPSLIVLALTAAIVISSCGPGVKLSFKDAGSPDSRNSQKADMDYRINSSPGEGWKNQPGLNDMVFFLPGTSSVIYVGRIPINERTKQMHPEEVYMAWIHGMQNKYQMGNILTGSGRTTTIDNRESYYTSYEYIHGSGTRKEKVYFIRGNSYFYRIRYSSPKVNYNENLRTFEKYVKSFKIVS